MILILWLLFPTLVWANEDSGFSPASTGLSARLLCETVSVFQSDVGLLAGLAIAVWGLWTLISKGSMKTGITLIIAGALVTALPSLAGSFLSGASRFMKQTGISDEDLTDSMNYAFNNAGHCDSIEVDMSAYDWSSPDAYGENGAYTRGRPDLAGAQRSSPLGAGESGRVNPNAAVGQAGCTNLVEGGISGSPFGPRTSERLSNGSYSSSYHKGVDIRCGGRTGNEIYAAGAGTVLSTPWSQSYGRRVIIDHGGGKITTYNHLNDWSTSGGASVSAGQVIGHCGLSGNTNGPHLHFEMKINGEFVDPVSHGCGA